MRKVYVTGMGLATCIGRDESSAVEHLKSLRHGIVRYPPFADPAIPVKVAAPIPGFEIVGTDPEDWVFPEGLRFRMEQYRCLSPNVLYACYAMQQAIENAGLTEDEVSHPRTGMFTASAGSAMMTWMHMDRLKRLGPVHADGDDCLDCRHIKLQPRLTAQDPRLVDGVCLGLCIQRACARLRLR